MNFFAKAIHTLDPENQESLEREAPDTFESFVDELFDYINTNKSVRYFKIRSLNTEVVSAIFEIINSENNTLFNEKSKIIVNRLLRIEKETQEEIKRLGTKVRKGSVIQSIAHGENNDIIYLLAKVQHSDFVDDNDSRFQVQSATPSTWMLASSQKAS